MFLAVALALVAGAATHRDAGAQASGFPRIAVWSFPGLYCPACTDTIVPKLRTVAVRFLRDRHAEARPDFGGYRIYRATGSRDTTNMMLVRRFTLNQPDQYSWYFSRVDTTDATLPFKKNGVVAHDSIITFVDPDSNGHYIKVCRKVDNQGRCLSKGDSIYVIEVPAGPHDGFITYYSITYEQKNQGSDGTYEDMYIAGRDTLDGWARCGTPGDTTTCPIINLNNRALNMTPAANQPVMEPTGGPTENLETVKVVPNPYRGSEAWDQSGQAEVHFTNLPADARIRIFTLSGDLVAEIHHTDPVRDFERWNLKNQNGADVASGVYMYRIESGSFALLNRFVVIR
jgi:hypothetical protein